MARKAAIVAVVIVVILVAVILLGTLLSQPKQIVVPPRLETIPASAEKMTPQTDIYPPILKSVFLLLHP
jgi:hypothetical protein